MVSRVVVCAALALLVSATSASAQFAPLAGIRSAQPSPEVEATRAALEAAQNHLSALQAPRDSSVERLSGSRFQGIRPNAWFSVRESGSAVSGAAEAAAIAVATQAVDAAEAAYEAARTASRGRRVVPVVQSDSAANVHFLGVSGKRDGMSGFRPVGSAGLALPGDGDAALFVEFFSDNASFGPVGWGRVGFGALVQSDGDSTDTAPPTADAFLNNGGNASLYVALPLLFLPALRADAGKATEREMFHLSALLSPRLSATLPALNGGGDVQGGLVDLAAEVRTHYETFRGIFRFGGVLRGGYVPVSPEAFRESLGASHTFGYLQADIGLDIADRFRVGFRKALLGPSGLVDAPPSFVFQLIPASTDSTR